MVHPWRRDRRFDEIFCDKFNLREEYRAFTIRGEGVYPHAATKFRQKFIQLVPTASKMHGTTPLQSPRNSVCQVNKFHPRRYVSHKSFFAETRVSGPGKTAKNRRHFFFDNIYNSNRTGIIPGYENDETYCDTFEFLFLRFDLGTNFFFLFFFILGFIRDGNLLPWNIEFMDYWMK